jgi:hypothetical protein
VEREKTKGEGGEIMHKKSTKKQKMIVISNHKEERDRRRKGKCRKEIEIKRVGKK